VTHNGTVGDLNNYMYYTVIECKSLLWTISIVKTSPKIQFIDLFAKIRNLRLKITNQVFQTGLSAINVTDNYFLCN